MLKHSRRNRNHTQRSSGANNLRTPRSILPLSPRKEEGTRVARLMQGIILHRLRFCSVNRSTPVELCIHYRRHVRAGGSNDQDDRPVTPWQSRRRFEPPWWRLFAGEAAGRISIDQRGPLASVIRKVDTADGGRRARRVPPRKTGSRPFFCIRDRASIWR